MKKIMFDDKFHLTEAVLNGTKTVTRRAVPASLVLECGMGMDAFVRSHARYKVGETVAVAQRYKDVFTDDDLIVFDDGLEIKLSKGWSNKMFVSADLMPHHIRITDVRLERITDISDRDCLSEGVSKSFVGYFVRGLRTRDWEKESHVEMDGTTYKLFPTPKKAFKALIDKECGRQVWADNKYVFVYRFTLLD